MLQHNACFSFSRENALLSEYCSKAKSHLELDWKKVSNMELMSGYPPATFYHKLLSSLFENFQPQLLLLEARLCFYKFKLVGLSNDLFSKNANSNGYGWMDRYGWDWMDLQVGVGDIIANSI